MSKQSVSDETKEVFKDFISRINQIEETHGVSVITEEIMASKKTSKSPPVNVDAGMLSILEKLNNVVSSKVKDAILTEQATSTDPEFAMAMKTVQTPTGVKMSKWEIIKIREGKFISYHIEDKHTHQTIVENLSLYKVASQIIKILESGKHINDRDVTRLLRLDEDFAFYYKEALFFKDKYEKTKKDLYEHRFQYSKGKVDSLKEQIVRECL